MFIENTHPVKILIAEDSEPIQRLLEIYVKQKGWDCCLVGDGAKAVAEAALHNYDLIIMDINMPVMNGIEATRNIRRNDPNIPIIALTAYDEEDIKESSFNAGVNYFLAKPCRREELFSIVSKFLIVLF